MMPSCNNCAIWSICTNCGCPVAVVPIGKNCCSIMWLPGNIGWTSGGMNCPGIWVAKPKGICVEVGFIRVDPSATVPSPAIGGPAFNRMRGEATQRRRDELSPIGREAHSQRRRRPLPPPAPLCLASERTPRECPHSPLWTYTARTPPQAPTKWFTVTLKVVQTRTTIRHGTTIRRKKSNWTRDYYCIF